MQLRDMQSCYKEDAEMLTMEELGYFIYMDEIEREQQSQEEASDDEEKISEEDD